MNATVVKKITARKQVEYLNKEGNVSGITYGGEIKINNYQFDYVNVPLSQTIGYERANGFSPPIRF